MLPLLLTIASSLTISLLLKLNEVREGNRLVVAGSNYIIAAALGLLLSSDGGITALLDLPPQWLGFGLLVGAGFVAGFLLLMRTIREVGLAITASVARIATLGPVLLSIWIYNEHPTPIAAIGIVIGLIAFIFLGLDRSRTPLDASIRTGGIILLLFLFLVMTFNDFSMKVAEVSQVDRGALLSVIFGSAGVFSWSIFILQRRRRTGTILPSSSAAKSPTGSSILRSDILRGLALGVPNFFSSWFLIAALEELSGPVVFPITSAAGVILSTLAAVIIWKERPGRRGWIGIGLAALAVVLLGSG